MGSPAHEHLYIILLVNIRVHFCIYVLWNKTVGSWCLCMHILVDTAEEFFKEEVLIYVFLQQCIIDLINLYIPTSTYLTSTSVTFIIIFHLAGLICVYIIFWFSWVSLINTHAEHFKCIVFDGYFWKFFCPYLYYSVCISFFTEFCYIFHTHYKLYVHVIYICCIYVYVYTEHMLSSVQFSCSVMSDSLRPHELQHSRPPCPSPTPGVHPTLCPLSQWCHPTNSSSVFPFSSCPQYFPASGSFQMSQLLASGGQSIGVSASASVLPTNTQDWSPLGRTGWSPWSPLDSQESSPTPQFKSINFSALSFIYSPILISIHDHWKNHSLD